MEVVAEFKRPWTIKWAVGMLVFLLIIANIYVVTESWKKPFSLISDIVMLVLLFAIWQGKMWGRNLLFFYLLFFLPLLIWLAGILLITTDYHWQFSFRHIYSLLGTGMFVLSVFMTFMKPSTEWFLNRRTETFKDDSQQLSWHFQLTVIGISMGLGFVVITVNTMADFLSLGKEIMMNASTYYSRFIVLLSFESLGFLIGAMTVIFPFGFMIGYWKNMDTLILVRLITMGAILPTLVFPVGKTFFIFSVFLFSKIAIIALTSYFALVLGAKTRKHFEKLKQWKATSS